ncbi:MAG: flagellar biosynthesis protein FlhB [Pigmentiphaga sp.]|nr:flagellar biosynthesis protein FlhB [Pigmentiphaga sp.]
MAENQDSGQEKTLAPSQRRLDKAREEGQVARSRDLSAALGTFGCVLAVMLTGSYFVQQVYGWMRHSFSTAAINSAQVRDDAILFKILVDVLASGLLVVLPIAVAGMVMGVLGSMALGGLVLSSKALMPKFSKLDPIKGLGRIFSLTGLAELGKSLLKVIVLMGVAGAMVWTAADAWLALVLTTPKDALGSLGTLLLRHAMIMAGALFVIAAVDVPLQWWKHHKQLKMTLQEMKQENKETEGDPHVRGRIRQLQRQRARARMMEEIPGADVVITNPTHYAVALKYDEKSMSAPRVVAKGVDLVASRIRELASEHRVMQVESPKLARALHQHTEVNEEVPGELFRAVAQILAYVYQVRDHVRGPAPVLPPVAIPEGWDPLEARQPGGPA